MKSISLIALLALIVAAPAPKAEARDNTGAIIGGIVGGVIIGSILSDDDCDVTTTVSVGYDSRHRSYGHWEWTSVRTWVPGCHEFRRDACGNRYRVWVPGYYTYTRQRVWVADNCPPSRYGHDRYDRRDRYDRYDDRRRDDRHGGHWNADDGDRDNRREARVSNRF